MQIQHVFSRHWRAIVFLIVLTLIFTVVYAWRSVLLPFMVGLLITFILHPIVVWLEKVTVFPPWLQKHKRVIVVVLLMIAMLILTILAITYLLATMINTGQQLLDNASEILASVTSYFSNLLEGIRSNMSPDVQARIDEIVGGASDKVTNAVENIVSRSFSLIPTTIGFVFGFATLPMFVFYLLKDWEKLRDNLYNGLPRSAAIHTRNVLGIISKVMGRYLRAQLLLGFVVGSVTFGALLIMGVNFGLALVIGLIAGFFEMVPTIGPWISGVIGSILILATYPDLILWAIGLFLLIQILENNFLVPRFQGQAQNLHPAIALVLLVLGAYLAGLWGIVLAIPIAATIVQVFRYTDDAARFEDHLPLLHHDSSIFEK